MLGDAYGAAVVEALSKKELEAMDEERRKELENEDDLESAQTDLKGKKVKIVLLQWCLDYYIPLVHKPYVNEVCLNQDYIP